MPKQVHIGLIGHKFMGRAHSHALRALAHSVQPPLEPVMHTLCGMEDDLPEVARRYGWQSHTRLWQEVVNDPRIDVIDIATPGNTHCEIAVAAARAGKHLLCEKPLALNLAEAEQMYEAVRQAGVKHLVNLLNNSV